MSLKELEEAIKLRPMRDWKAHAEQYYMTMEKWFKEVLNIEFAKFKKQVVCIPRKQLEEYRQGHVTACHCDLCELLRKVEDSKKKEQP